MEKEQLETRRRQMDEGKFKYQVAPTTSSLAGTGTSMTQEEFFGMLRQEQGEQSPFLRQQFL